MTVERVASVAAVPEDSTYLFTVRDADDEEREVILAETADGIAAWLNYCQHFTHIKLDKGSGAPRRNGELVCANHGAMFDADSGLCTFGPCEGAVLNEVAVAVREDAVYLTDDAYDYDSPGPVETDDDLTSTSNVEF
jgi:nitrite reductase/ring-hydroxylating ferredoxin subunit